MEYLIKRAVSPPEGEGAWMGPVWGDVPVIEVAAFYAPSAQGRRPRTQAKLLHNGDGLHVMFRVAETHVRCVRTHYQDPVWKDSCVEFFVQPRRDKGYFNFEVNCGGALLLKYIEDPTRTPVGFVKYEDVPESLGGLVRIYHSLPEKVEPEIEEEITWRVEYCIPWRLFEVYVGAVTPAAGQTWRGNFYKCAEENSRPHWASWAPIEGPLNFHQPQFFAPLRFEE